MSHFDEKEKVNERLAALWEKSGLGFNDHSIPPASIEKFAYLLIDDILTIMNEQGNEKSILIKQAIEEAYGYSQSRYQPYND